MHMYYYEKCFNHEYKQLIDSPLPPPNICIHPLEILIPTIMKQEYHKGYKLHYLFNNLSTSADLFLFPYRLI